jgi:type VI secretion system protein VasD
VSFPATLIYQLRCSRRLAAAVAIAVAVLAVLPQAHGDSAKPATTGAAPQTGVPPVGATELELTIVGGPQLNPNSEGRASPVVVRVFGLKASQGFESADYAALFERATETLKADVLAQEEFVLRPGDIQHRDRAPGPQERVIGVAAAFRRIEGALWKLVIPLKPGVRNQLLIDLNADRVRLAPVDVGPP